MGNFYARRRLELVKRFLPFVGLDPRRFHYTWVSASEGQRWQEVVTEFSAVIQELGPNPGIGADDPPMESAGQAASAFA